MYRASTISIKVLVVVCFTLLALAETAGVVLADALNPVPVPAGDCSPNNQQGYEEVTASRNLANVPRGPHGALTVGSPMTCPAPIWPCNNCPPTTTKPLTGVEKAAIEEVCRGAAISGQAGCSPLTGSQFARIIACGAILSDKLNKMPERNMHLAREQQNVQTQQNADNAAGCARQQAACAIDCCRAGLKNFTVDEGNKWNRLRNELFVPIAILLLLPGAIATQVKATVAQGFSIFGEVSPLEGIQRSLIAAFLIPASVLVVNYGIDLSNSIGFTIQSEYKRIFGTDMYEDAMGAEVSAFPLRDLQSERNHIPLQPANMNAPVGRPATTPGGQFNESFQIRDFNPSTGVDITPPDRAREQVPYVTNAHRAGFNGMNAALTTTWNILCAFQQVYLYYLWFVGPVMAALWVWPIKQMRDAFPNWCEGVITLCFWSLFWHTTVLVMACLNGVEGETLFMSALNFLSTACVKFAFDFAGLVKAAGQEAGKAAEKAMQGEGAGGGKGGGGGQSGQGGRQSEGSGNGSQGGSGNGSGGGSDRNGTNDGRGNGDNSGRNERDERNAPRDFFRSAVVASSAMATGNSNNAGSPVTPPLPPRSESGASMFRPPVEPISVAPPPPSASGGVGRSAESTPTRPTVFDSPSLGQSAPVSAGAGYGNLPVSLASTNAPMQSRDAAHFLERLNKEISGVASGHLKTHSLGGPHAPHSSHDSASTSGAGHSGVWNHILKNGSLMNPDLVSAGSLASGVMKIGDITLESSIAHEELPRPDEDIPVLRAGSSNNTPNPNVAMTPPPTFGRNSTEVEGGAEMPWKREVYGRTSMGEHANMTSSICDIDSEARSLSAVTQSGGLTSNAAGSNELSNSYSWSTMERTSFYYDDFLVQPKASTVVDVLGQEVESDTCTVRSDTSGSSSTVTHCAEGTLSRQSVDSVQLHDANALPHPTEARPADNRQPQSVLDHVVLPVVRTGAVLERPVVHTAERNGDPAAQLGAPKQVNKHLVRPTTMPAPIDDATSVKQRLAAMVAGRKVNSKGVASPVQENKKAEITDLQSQLMSVNRVKRGSSSKPSELERELFEKLGMPNRETV